MIRFHPNHRLPALPRNTRLWLTILGTVILNSSAIGQPPTPLLKTVFPAGCQAGGSERVVITGGAMDGISAIRSSHSGIVFDHDEDNHFTVHVAADTPPGFYDVQAICAAGISSTRTFFVTTRKHVLEAEDDSSTVNVVISGQIKEGGEVDEFQFPGKAGQRIVIECWADRMDSPLRAILELFDSSGQRLASSAGYFGIDPAISYSLPTDGQYVVRLYDLEYSGSTNHFYRLDIGVGPRVLFALPSVVQRGQPTQVTLYGWNLNESQEVFTHFTVDVTPPDTPIALPIRRHAASVGSDGFAYYLPGSDVPIEFTTTDAPVILDPAANHTATAACPITIPCEVSGQLSQGNEYDWYSFEAKRGEVIHVEAWGERIGSPVDLDIMVLDTTGQQVLATFHDEITNTGGLRFPTSHLDPAGRWVAPTDGRFFLVVRNLIGGLSNDPRRVYRLNLRHEESDFSLVALPHTTGSPGAINVHRGGRTIVDVLAFRHRGLTGAIRISPQNLPPGIDCQDVWLGPGVNSAPLVLTATDNAKQFVGALELVGTVEQQGRTIQHPVQGGTMVRTDLPNGSGRLTADVPWAIGEEAPLRITANGHETRKHQLYGELTVQHSAGGILDVAVHVQRRDSKHQAPVRLTGVGLPGLISNQVATIEPGQQTGYISFYLPQHLPPGWYTLAIGANTTVATPDGKERAVEVISNTVTFEVHPPAFQLELDPYTPRRVQRGEVVKINYTVHRKNGFIGKIHTELAAPGMVTDVGNLRGRGVTFVGQTESGVIQIIVNEDAQLGSRPFLRLYAVGVLEDEALFHGSCFLDLEIIE